MFSLKMANLFFLADKLTSILFECVFTSVLVRGPLFYVWQNHVSAIN